MSCAQAHWVGSKPIHRVMQLKLHKPAMAIGYSLRMCTRHVDSTNPDPSNLVFSSKPIPEVKMSNREDYCSGGELSGGEMSVPLSLRQLLYQIIKCCCSAIQV